MNRADFQQLALVRLDEARGLLEAGFPSGAYYLAGYAVECALKSVIASQTQQFDFPEKKRVNDSYTHDLEKLDKLARLGLDTVQLSSPSIGRSWSIVSQWSEEDRYLLCDADTATEMIFSVGDPKKGVLPWIMQYW